MTPLAVVDTGALVASVSLRDRDHARVRTLMLSRAWDFVVPALCIAEAAFLIARDVGWAAEANFLATLSSAWVEMPEASEWPRVAELVRQYKDFPIGGTDASVVSLAERLTTDTIVTLDHRHFRAIKPRHCEFFRLLPEI